MQVKSKSGRSFDLHSDEQDAKIREGIANDPDTYEVSTEEIKAMRPMGRPKAVVTKDSVTIRLSPEVTSYFRNTGKGWQTRVDNVLKEYVSAQQ